MLRDPDCGTGGILVPAVVAHDKSVRLLCPQDKIVNIAVIFQLVHDVADVLEAD